MQVQLDAIRSKIPEVVRRHPDAVPWLPWAWLVVLFVSNVKTATRDAGAALAGSASIDNLVELGVYGLIGAGCVAVLTRRRHRRTQSAGVLLLLTYGTLAVASATWSVAPVFSFVRGGQIVVIGMLALVSLEAWRSGRRDATVDLQRIWIWFCVVLALLLTVGAVANPGAPRFAWPGTHPIFVGAYLALGATAASSMLLERSWHLAVGRRRMLMAALALFLPAMLLNWTRSTLTAFAIASLAVYGTRSARRLDLRWLVLPFVGLTGIAALILFSDALTTYVLRGESMARLATLSERTDLWSAAIEYAAERPVLGSGYGTGRGIFLELFPWAGNAHSLWMELLVDLGIAGVAIGAGILGWWMWTAASMQARSPRPISSLALGMALVTAVAGLAETGFAFPGLFLSVAALSVAGLGAERSLTGATHRWRPHEMVPRRSMEGT